MPARIGVRWIACRNRSSPSQGSSRQYLTRTSMNELPVASMTRKPVRSRTSATGRAMPACMRMPQRLCWPSRSVVSRSSTCDTLLLRRAHQPQLAPEDLAGVVARKLLDDVVLPGALVTGDRIQAAGVERVGVDVGSCTRHDVGDDRLAPHQVGDAD